MCAPTVSLYNLGPSTASLRERIVRGLRQPVKELPPCLMYDARGARLFESLCRSPDYSFDRAERAFLRRHGAEIGRCMPARSLLVEYGSGPCRTTELLLRHLLMPAAYLPVDWSMAQLKRGVRRLSRRAPDLTVMPVRADFTARFALPMPQRRHTRTIVYLAAATLAALPPAQTVDVLRGVARLCGRRGGVLVGIDLNRDAARLERAYNDRDGLTRSLNLNILSHANRRFAGNFQPRRFLHYSFYSESGRRAELHLLSQADQTVAIGGARVMVRKGEAIRTDAMYQYPLGDLRRFAEAAGLQLAHSWIDDEGPFAMQFFAVPS
ncbi:MAG TPA: L-histidine N(alpha)-methyltransferase [Pirellulales bacterium]